MSTIIYPSPIFGPVHSRRLGISLGINLLPADGKICTFDCIYCECGYNAQRHTSSPHPPRALVAEKLEEKLKEMKANSYAPDVLTFAGNGEPTSHPHFYEIIQDTISLRNIYCPTAKISVLSNSTFIHRPKVHEALRMVDNNILKLDTINTEWIKKVDRPTAPSYNVKKIIENMKAFKGKLIIQTMFLKGYNDQGENITNTSETFVKPWLEAVEAIAPKEVMIYTIERETPASHLRKASHEELDAICERVKSLGIACQASY
ncbi:radical SAM protein [Prevotella amnii]|jgi:radical SAM domain protein|uniref:Fe-S oxidoreductase n=1 Tax=Prevotella amnii DNF00058 TaxID=1401066 RepID=A0A096D536_9BACT|nr:radical SAM protein [Prevotella amnii]KGF52644.1 Fe-S oxidoreductase [Prevotella amnii DNF00058]